MLSSQSFSNPVKEYESIFIFYYLNTFKQAGTTLSSVQQRMMLRDFLLTQTGIGTRSESYPETKESLEI